MSQRFLAWLAVFSCACSAASPNHPDLPTTTSDAGTSSDAMIAPLEYPEGPYGVAEQQTVPRLALHGYAKAQGPWVPIDLGAYWDPSGKKGSYAIYLMIGSTDCSNCYLQSQILSSVYADKYEKRGVVMLDAILTGPDLPMLTPTPKDTVDEWLASLDESMIPKLFDTMASPDDPTNGKNAIIPDKYGVGLPFNYVIDSRTMKIVKVKEGIDGITQQGVPDLDAALDALNAPK